MLASDDGRAAVAALLEEAKVEVTSLLKAHRHLAEALRDALLDREELVGDEIIKVITGAVPEAV